MDEAWASGCGIIALSVNFNFISFISEEDHDQFNGCGNMEKEAEAKNIFLIAIAFGFFFFGDIITTFHILKNGGVELNGFLESIGFNGFVIFKILLIFIFSGMIYYLDKFKFYKESGIVIGMVLMSGLLATLFNLGYFR